MIDPLSDAYRILFEDMANNYELLKTLNPRSEEYAHIRARFWFIAGTLFPDRYSTEGGVIDGEFAGGVPGVVVRERDN